MEELKPCPHCGSTNVGISPYDGAKTVVCMNCLCMSAAYRGENAEANAAAAWNRRVVPENKPLTLDNLWRCAAEHTAIYVSNADGTAMLDGQQYCAAIVDRISGFGTMGQQHIQVIYGRCLTLAEDDYGKTWLAYAHKPEGPASRKESRNEI